MIKSNRHFQAAVFCFFAALAGLLYFSLGSRNSDRKGASAVSSRSERGYAATISESIQRDGKASARSSTGSSRSVERYVDEQLIRSPLSATGVNQQAMAHYKLSDEQASEIANVLRESRAKVVEMIVKSMEESDPGGAAARLLIFRPKAEEAAEIKAILHRDLSRIAGSDFADSGIKVIDGDFRLLNLGAREIRIEINPGESSSAAGVQRVRLKIMSPDLAQASTWEGTPEVLKDAYWIEIDP